MSSRRTTVFAFLAALALGTPAAGAATLKGKLNARGYTVFALSRTGAAVSAAAKPSFSLKAPSGTYTLHLRAPNGTYGGPVVVSGAGAKVVVGLRGGGKLPLIKIANGFGRVSRKAPKRMVANKLTARARKGRPLGAGNFGAIRIVRARAAQDDETGPTGADPDGDGVPSAVDIDDNGDLVLDNVQTSAPSAGQAIVFHALTLNFLDTLNANAGPIAKEQVDKALVDNLFETFIVGSQPAGVDCGGLSYCSAGGTGTVKNFEDRNSHEPFPDCCDDEHPGIGVMTATVGGNAFVLDPHATSDQIRAGDTYIFRRDSGELTGTLNYVFQTVPAVTAYSDGTTQGTISYPVAAGSPGTPGKPIELHANADGHLVLQLTLWRPQRRGLPGTGEGDFIDMGGLRYAVTVHSLPTTPAPGTPPAPNAGGPHECPQDTYSAFSGDLSAAPDGKLGFLRDAAADRAPDPANTLSFTVDLTACLASVNATWDVGQIDLVQLEAKDATFDHADQPLNLKRVS